MTWSTSVEPTPASEFEQAVEQLSFPGHETALPTPETLHQFEAAKSAVLALWQSGAIGDPTMGIFNASLGGHANPQHTADATMSGDTISVYVYRVVPDPTMTTTEQETLSPSGA